MNRGLAEEPINNYPAWATDDRLVKALATSPERPLPERRYRQEDNHHHELYAGGFLLPLTNLIIEGTGSYSQRIGKRILLDYLVVRGSITSREDIEDFVGEDISYTPYVRQVELVLLWDRSPPSNGAAPFVNALFDARIGFDVYTYDFIKESLSDRIVTLKRMTFQLNSWRADAGNTEFRDRGGYHLDFYVDLKGLFSDFPSEPNPFNSPNSGALYLVGLGSFLPGDGTEPRSKISTKLFYYCASEFD